MKAVLSLIISGALVVSGYSQTRNVLVGTNNAVVQPTNFWSVDASNARTGLGLGTAATNPASVFQSSSANLTNLAANNGGSLTNIKSTNLVGIIPSSNLATVNFSNLAGTLSIASGGTSATNAVNARQNLGSTTVGDALFVATNAESARTTIGATTIGSSVFTLANPNAITFLRVNSNNTVSALSAADFRTALSLGAAATNPSSAFQPSSTVLSNLASSNGVNLTNLQASNVTGTIAISNGGTGSTNAGGARTNFGLGNIFTNTFQTTNTAVYVNTNIVATNGSLTFGFVNATYLDAPWFFVEDGTNGIQFETTDVAAITRTNLGIGAEATNTVGFGKIAFNTSLVIEEPVNDAAIITFQNDTDPVVLNPTFWNDANVRQSLGFSTNLTSFWTSTNAAVARTALNLDQTNSVAFLNLRISNGSQTNLALAIGSTDRGFFATSGPERISTIVGGSNIASFFSGSFEVNAQFSVVSNATVNGSINVGGPISFIGASSNIAITRTNLGLGWSALTNSNAGTGLVSVDTNGDVVSPTNFWQRAPIQTAVQDFTGITVNQTNNATNARNVYVYSLATNVSGISNTIILPTNVSTFNGDEVTVVHKGTTNTTTVVRQAGSTNNLITLNKFDESVKFIRELGQWDFYHNISFVEPIQFSGTNASANAAASRVNLGLGTGDNVTFQNITISDQTLTLSHGSEDDVFVRNESGNLEFGTEGNGVYFKLEKSTLSTRFDVPIYFGNTTNAATTRTNLGLGLPALTNTNNTTFQQAIFTTNAAPTNAGNFGNNVAWMGVNIVTNGVTNTFLIPLYK